jgi:putative addiction module killer protein
MFEVHKTEDSNAGFWVFRIRRPLRRSSRGLSGLGWAIRATSKPLAKALVKCGYIYGPGYRVYYKRTDKTIMLILCGGDKTTQAQDIERAKEIAAQL